VIPGASPRVAAPISESRADAPPSTVIHILREWPDATARVVIVGAACALFWLTWAHWGDIQVDCGREVYVPYQILRGKLLYRDLWYPYGPLEPYVSALLLKLFGEHLSVLYFLGLALAIGCALVLFEVGKMLAGRAVGLAAALALLLQGFQPSIFNYIFPYTYSASMGLLFALLCLVLTLRHVLGRPRHNLMLAGLMAGLALLTKQEMGVACYILIAFVLLIEAAQQRSLRAVLCGLGTCVPGFLLNVVIYGWLFWMLTPSFVFDNWVGPNRYFIRTYEAHLYAIAGLRFYPIEMTLLIVNAGVAVFLWFWIARFSAVGVGVGRFWWRFAAIVLLVIAVTLARHFAPLTMYVVLATLVYPRGMFFIGCAFFTYTLYGLRKRSTDRRLLAEAALAIFALTLAIRVLAQIEPFGYSIFYDAPLVLTFIIAAGRCIDIAGRSLAVELRLKLLDSLLAMQVLMLAIVLIPGASRRMARLETSWGDIYLQPAEATVARQIIEFISEQRRQGRRVALLPEMPMMYALTGTEAPSRLYTLQPGFLPPSQEKDYIANLKRADPYYIVLTNRNTSEYGVPYFGIDYDQKVYRWIEANYRVTGEFGRFSRNGSRLLTAIVYERLSQSEPIALADSIRAQWP
jgi:hypothetical protein